jgi:6-phosphogluconolactonase
MTSERRVLVHPDAESLTASVAARFLTKVIDLLDENESIDVCLTGGSTGIGVLAAIAVNPARDGIDWSRVSFWWGDERYVPRGDADRNDQQGHDALLDALPVPPENLHPFPAPGEHATIEEAADAYAAELGDTVFDIMLLGVGPDGHIASLFPDHATVHETTRKVVAETNSPKPPPLRLSLTFPVINASQRIWLVLAGADKAGALGLALADANVGSVPVAGVRGRKRTVFFVDQAASAEVPENLIDRERYWTAKDDAN